MLRFAVVLFLAVSVSAGSFNMPRLYSKFSMNGTPDVDSFFTIPRTAEEAKAKGWVTPPETKSNKLFRTFCAPNDPTTCILCDNKGSIAGYQISISTNADVNGIKGMNYPQKGFKTQTLFGKKVYSNQIWFVPQEVLTSGGRDFNKQTGQGLWLQVRNELVKVPIHEKDMLKKTTKFVKQNCFARMGQHYFWDVRADLTPADFMPWFVLYNPEGHLSGFGFLVFGKQADLSSSKPWLENIAGPSIQAIAPDVPKWVIEEGARIGMISTHVYFGEEPWNSKCAAK